MSAAPPPNITHPATDDPSGLDESVSENTFLLQRNSSAQVETYSQKQVSSYCQPLSIFRWTLVFLFFCGIAILVTNNEPKRVRKAYYTFPSNFVWGVATSAYQIEGAFNEEGRRGPNATIWDVFVRQPGRVADNSTGDIADDHYHRVKADLALMKSLNIKAYRFSIAWSRILPNGTGDYVNPSGIAFYNHLIDKLLENDIEPFVTLFHWDLPQPLEDQYSGWLGIETTDAFVEYARVCFENFGDRVSRWITMNEAWTVSVNGYASGLHAPGHVSPTEPYIVGHHLLLAHAKAARLYKNEYAEKQNGMIGIANSGDYRYPLTESRNDREAAERAISFQLGWFTDPIFLGKYPDMMRERLGTRLPEFSKEEQRLIHGSADFIGLNYYSAFMASEPLKEASYDGFWSHIYVNFTDDPSWEHNDMGKVWNTFQFGWTFSEMYGYELF